LPKGEPDYLFATGKVSILLIIVAVGISVAVVIITEINAGGITLSRVETWWFTAYRDQDIEKAIDPRKGADNHPPVNGFIYSWPFNRIGPRLIPHFVVWAWLAMFCVTVLLTFRYFAASSRHGIWAVFPQSKWFGAVLVPLGLIAFGLLVPMTSAMVRCFKIYDRNFLRISHMQCKPPRNREERGFDAAKIGEIARKNDPGA
jgi:hypothetical protein